jgi:ubiquinone/menaquinone biosynthesis C-methylase UbiE
MDLDEYRQASHETWEAMARGWERDRAFIWDVTRTVGERMVAALDPKPGEIVLELAAGTGETGFAAAGMVGSDGRLFSTDFSPAMVDAARRRGASRTSTTGSLTPSGWISPTRASTVCSAAMATC